MFDSLYHPDDRDRAIFGDRYDPPETFEHGEWHTVARLPKAWADGDGQAVEIDECRMPARFFRLRVLAGPNSLKRIRPGYQVSTGSGDEAGRLLWRIAKAVTGGMLSFRQEDTQCLEHGTSPKR